mgnify:CR=1 FL=1
MGNYPYSSRTNHADFGTSLEWQSLPEVGADRRGGGHGTRRLFVASMGLFLVGIAVIAMVLHG